MIRSFVRKLSGDKSGGLKPVSTDANKMADPESKSESSPKLAADPKVVSPETVTTIDAKDLPVKNGELAEKVTISQTLCKSCDIDFDKQKPKGKMTCCMCQGGFCFGCTKAKKGDSSDFLKRNDVWWTCNECTPVMYEVMKNPKVLFELSGGSEAPKAQTVLKLDDPIVKSILPAVKELLIEPITAKIEETIAEKIPHVVDHSVNTSIAKTWAAAIGDGANISSENQDDPETDFSIVLTRQQKKAAAAQIQAIKEVATQQQLDDGKREEREKNIVLFRVPESTAENAEDQKKDDQEFVKNLLKTIKVNDEDDDASGGGLCPKSIYRLGKLDKKRNSSRPIKVEFASKMDQNLVMNNAKNLKGAPAQFSRVSICYDLSETERQNLSLLNEKANEKSKNSTEFIWKVRGPPGKMEIKRFPRRK